MQWCELKNRIREEIDCSEFCDSATIDAKKPLRQLMTGSGGD